MKIISANSDSTVVELSKVEVAMLATTLGRFSEYDTIELVSADYGAEIDDELRIVYENLQEGKSASYEMYDALDNIAKGRAPK